MVFIGCYCIYIDFYVTQSSVLPKRTVCYSPPLVSALRCLSCAALSVRAGESCDTADTDITSKEECGAGVDSCLTTVMREEDGWIDVSRSCGRVGAGDRGDGCTGDLDSVGAVVCACSGRDDCNDVDALPVDDLVDAYS